MATKKKAAAKKTAKKTAKKSVPAKTGPKDLTPANAAELMAADAGQGIETAKADDMAIPFIGILQSNSPQVLKKNPAYVDGAEAGDFFNNATGDVYSGDDGILIIPCQFNKQYVEWIPRDQGGGFCGTHSNAAILSKCKRNEKGRDVHENGHEIVPTAYHYCLLVDGDKATPVVLSLSSTQLKKSRRWVSAIAGQKIKGPNGSITAPSFAFIYRATTVSESNDKGNWYGWNIAPSKMVDSVELYTAGKDFYVAVSSGAVRMGPPPESESESVPETSEF